ncbi:uncharacterized protein [Rutidosis leptorrhynchoides]|uniref:uncharacterized protein n=1 Tax=Rutidosis leptorrhynchoides TaxID=125765 RepID=UPI003A99B181
MHLFKLMGQRMATMYPRVVSKEHRMMMYKRALRRGLLERIFSGTRMNQRTKPSQVVEETLKKMKNRCMEQVAEIEKLNNLVLQHKQEKEGETLPLDELRNGSYESFFTGTATTR